MGRHCSDILFHNVVNKGQTRSHQDIKTNKKSINVVNILCHWTKSSVPVLVSMSLLEQ